MLIGPEIPKTKQQIWKGLFKTLETTPFDKVTINQICSAAEVSRTTFYRHYVDKFALIEKINLYYAEQLRMFSKRRQNLTDLTVILLELSDFFQSNAEEISACLCINDIPNPLQDQVNQVLHDEFTYFIENHPAIGIRMNLPLDYSANLYVAISMSFLTYALTNEITPEIIQSLDFMQKYLFY